MRNKMDKENEMTHLYFDKKKERKEGEEKKKFTRAQPLRHITKKITTRRFKYYHVRWSSDVEWRLTYCQHQLLFLKN